MFPALGSLSLRVMIKFLLHVSIVIIPDVLMTNPITKLYQSCLVAMESQTILAGMMFSITGTQNSHACLNSINSILHVLSKYSTKVIQIVRATIVDYLPDIY